MLAPIELPSSAVASRVASTKWRLLGAGRGPDRALQPLGRQREVGIAGEVAGQDLGGVDHHRGAAELRGRQHLLVADHHHVAAEHEVALARRDADGVDVLGLLGDADVAVDRAALLREAGLSMMPTPLPSRCAAMPSTPPMVTMPVPPMPVTMIE